MRLLAESRVPVALEVNQFGGDQCFPTETEVSRHPTAYRSRIPEGPYVTVSVPDVLQARTQAVDGVETNVAD